MPPPKDPIATLRRKRADIKTRITKYKTFLSTRPNAPDPDTVQVKSEALTENFKTIYNIHDELLELDEENSDSHYGELERMEEDYQFCIAETRKLLRTCEITRGSTSTFQTPNEIANNPNSTQRDSAKPIIKLPEITLPKFDGSIEKWFSFKDKFMARIDENINIRDVDKLQYLQASLTGRAARTIDSIESTGSNYKEAWKILTNKYDNTRKAILRHWSILHNFPRLSKDTSDNLVELTDTFRQHIRALKTLGEPTEHWDSCIIYLLTSKISENSRYQWETTLPDNKMPGYENLLEFLEKRGGCSDFVAPTTKENNTKFNYTKTPQKNYNQGHGKSFVTTTNRNHKTYNATCPICRELHFIYKCPTFRSMSINQRKQAAAQASLCDNCLGPNHASNECKGGQCRVCNEKHHTYLHPISQGSRTLDGTTTQSNHQLQSTCCPTPSTNVNSSKALTLHTMTDDIIPTARLHIANKNQNLILCRAIVDTGSTRNFITQELATMLQLTKTSCHVPISTLNELSTISKHVVKTAIQSRYNGYRKTLELLVVPYITSMTPERLINRKLMNIPPNIQLADPEFHRPAPIQLLIGAGTTLSTLCVGQITLSSQQESDLVLQKTQLGWIIGGNLPLYHKNNPSPKNYLLHTQEDISKFWEIEEIPEAKHLSEEETRCEEHFRTNTRRDNTGRYVVALPFNDNKQRLGESYQMSLKRLQSLERKFQKNSELHTKYTEVIRDYVDRGYMTELQNDDENGFYLPHQAVLKETSQTTKVRVVFDASAPSSTGFSLNDALMVGPVIQDDIFSLLLRFRLHNYVLTADIEKMYLQVSIHHEDQQYLRILWKDEQGFIKTYQFNRLIFGLKPASYLSTRCLQQLAQDEQRNYPNASIILQRDLYVDDLLTGANTVEQIVSLREEVTNLLKSGGFHLRQYASNTTDALLDIPHCNVNLQLLNDTDSTLKTLGVHWNSREDAIVYTVKPIVTNRATKRIIFSEISKIYDPLGLLNPVIVIAKLLMQELWKLQIDWDESLPTEIHTKWDTFACQLSSLSHLSFDRKMLQQFPQEIHLHGFCDASERAYGACVYLLSRDDDNNIRTQLYCAKSRVAPLKTLQTIPRLELSAALLLSRLVNSIKTSVNINFDRTFLWTDSTITLHWINTSPHLLKTFVANRVSDIRSKTDPQQWNHVPTEDNPADLLSRGLTPAEFKRSFLWVKGPTWLSEGEQNWPPQPTIRQTEVPEMRKITCLSTHTQDDGLLFKYSSYTKLQRVVAICLRVSPNNKQRGMLTVDELHKASTRILQLVQRMEFAEEYKSLNKGQTVHPKSKLLSLNPFIGNDGLIRVGGRLNHSDFSYQRKHPVVLPKSHHITRLIIEKEHNDNLHGGAQITLNGIRQKYWPLDGRNQVRKVLRRCVRCTRARPPPVNYMMGDLPKTRTTATRPFSNVGVDYCGPFLIKEKRFRNRKFIKVYVAVFICLATKAVHLEVASDLTTEGFIAALERFTSRRGRCVSIHSDNGTNFVGANNELRDLQALIKSKEHNDKIHNYLLNKEITWHFNPPHSPHFGGIWEAAVKSFKHHLRRVVGNESFTYEQLNTIVIGIEAILNSRPLTPLSSDPNDLNALTPAHFLIGDCLLSLPEQNFSKTPCNRLSTWQHVQKVKRDFWVRWHKEYINELNVRQKWANGAHPIKMDSIVIMRDDNLPTLQWRLGRVIETYPGRDGVIRTVKLKTATGELKRTVKGLAPLCIDDLESKDLSK